MYKTNLRDIRFPTENAPVILQKGLITKEDFTHSDSNVTLYNAPYAIAKRIFVWTDIEVLINEWTSVSNGDYAALEKAYTDMPTMVEEAPVVENEVVENEDTSVVEYTPEVVEEPATEQEAEEVIPEEEPTEVEEQQEETVEEEPEFNTDGEPAPEVIDEQSTEEVVEETVSEDQQSAPIAVPVTQQNNTQNYTRINNKRNKHNRR